MKHKQYYDLIRVAMDQPSAETFIGELGFPDWLHEQYGDDTDKMVSDLNSIYWIANATIADIRKTTGLSQRNFAERFAIPRRTVENWESKGAGGTDCPEYTRLMIADLLGLVAVERG